MVIWLYGYMAKLFITCIFSWYLQSNNRKEQPEVQIFNSSISLTHFYKFTKFYQRPGIVFGEHSGTANQAA
jgi:hypothetical protein